MKSLCLVEQPVTAFLRCGGQSNPPVNRPQVSDIPWYKDDRLVSTVVRHNGYEFRRIRGAPGGERAASGRRLGARPASRARPPPLAARVTRSASFARPDEGSRNRLALSAANRIDVWFNGYYRGTVAPERFIWSDYLSSAEHPGARIPLSPRVGENRIVLRVHGRNFAGGGFYADLVRPEN